MRARTLWLLGFALAPAALGVACSLNPQPLPPDNPDATGLGIDAGSDAKNGFDSGGIGDASFEAAPPPQTDGGVDASEDASDAETDAADASDAADADDAGADATSD